MDWLEMRRQVAEMLARAREQQTALTSEAGELDDTAIYERTSAIEELIAKTNALHKKADRLEALDTSVGEAESQQRQAAAQTIIDDWIGKVALAGVQAALAPR
jgi:hypothetical protein